MPTIVAFPTVVKDALDVFGDLVANEPERRHFAAYLTGRMIADKKTVSGITRACAVTTDPSCLNRWRHEVAWDVTALHDRRLAWLQEDPTTRDSARGVMALDKTLVDHAGQRIADVGWCWDHANERSVIAHDDLISTDVCPSGAPYPIAWRRFRKKDACPQDECKDHTEWWMELSDDAIARGIPGACAFDSSCTSAKVLHHMQRKPRRDVGDLQVHRNVVDEGRAQQLQDVARPMPWGAQQAVRVGNKCSWYFSKQMRRPDVTHAVRLVLFWKPRGAPEARKALGSNHLGGEVRRIVLVYRHRWTGTETFHRDGKQALGLGACQVRTGEGQTRHVYLVSAAYSLLLRSLHQRRPQDWARTMLTTIGEACRAVKAETLARMIDWVVDKLTVEHWSVTDIKAVLAYS
jgi:hypothetical protein